MLAHDLGYPLAHLLVGEDVVEAEHASSVSDGREQPSPTKTNGFRGRISPRELRELLLQRLKGLNQAVVVGVGGKQGVLLVVGLLQSENALREALYLCSRLLEFHASSLGRRTWADPDYTGWLSGNPVRSSGGKWPKSL